MVKVAVVLVMGFVVVSVVVFALVVA
jgi:hypothetical protein